MSSEIRVLVVEPDGSDALSGVAGALATRAPSYAAAPDVLRAGNYSAVVVCDTEDDTALRLVRALARDAAAPPVIFLAETTDAAEAARARAAHSLPRAAATPEVLAWTLRHAAAAHGNAPPAAAMLGLVWEWDVQSDAVLWVDALGTAFGYAPHEVGGSVAWWAERVHEDERETVVAGLRDVARGGADSWTALYRFRRADGSYAQVLDRARVLRDAAGRAARVVGSMQTLAGHGAAVGDADPCRDLLAVIPEAVLVSMDGRVAYANASAGGMLGLHSADEVIGRRTLDFIHPDYHEFAGARRKAAQAGARVPPAQERFVRADGRPVDVEVTAAPIEYRGEPALLVVARDIGERRRLEEQLRLAQRMEAVGRLAGGVAHDFNNLLTAIKGNADLLALDLPDGSPLREDVAEIQAAALRAAELTRQLLAFGRGQVLLPRLMELNGAVEASIAMLRRLVPGNVEVVTELDPACGWIHADPSQFDQILVNLALNARDAMPEGGRLRLRTANHDVTETDPRPAYMLAGAYVRLSVADDGHGMDPATREQVFEPFFTTRGAGRGAGLGLSTVYGIVKQSGGYITVDSEPGHGTAFHILLPRMADPGPAAAPGAAERAGGTARGTVLLVEDEDPVRRVTARVLRRSGFGVIEAHDGREALDLWTQHGASVDVVLTDLVMPRMGGEELARHIRAARPELPILFISGYTRGAALNRDALGPGAELIHKPFDADELAERIGVLLERSRKS
jgi:PAS domain S-box-containing protein